MLFARPKYFRASKPFFSISRAHVNLFVAHFSKFPVKKKFCFSINSQTVNYSQSDRRIVNFIIYALVFNIETVSDKSLFMFLLLFFTVFVKKRLIITLFGKANF